MKPRRITFCAVITAFVVLLGLTITNRTAKGARARPRRNDIMAHYRGSGDVMHTSLPAATLLADRPKVGGSGARQRVPGGWYVTSHVPQSGRDDKPVEQTRKNIQVLQGLPEAQLFPVMNFVGDSLGVHCDYCHVKAPGKNPQTGGDNWQWEKDDKPAKLRGREMMKMVLDINRANFGGRAAVTCFSCHRGGTGVARVVPVPPRDWASVGGASERAELPPAAQILNKYIAAVGGREAVAKFGAVVLQGTLERAQGRNDRQELSLRSDRLEITLKGPDKFLATVTTPQGVIMQGINGTDAWVRSASGTSRLGAEALAQSKQVVALYGVIKVPEQPEQMRVIGTEKIGERTAYVVALTVAPNRTQTFFFDTQTGLLLRRITTTETMLAPLPEQADFEDYRDVDGVKLPFTIRTSDTAAFSTATRRFTEIKHGLAVDDALFTVPAAHN